MDQEQMRSRWALRREEQLAAQEVCLFYTRFSMAMHSPSLSLVCYKSKLGRAASGPCSSLLLQTAVAHKSGMFGTWKGSTKARGPPTAPWRAPTSIASIPAAARKPGTAFSFSQSEQKQGHLAFAKGIPGMLKFWWFFCFFFLKKIYCKHLELPSNTSTLIPAQGKPAEIHNLTYEQSKLSFLTQKKLTLSNLAVVKRAPVAK